MRSVVKFSIRQSVLINVVFVILVVAGLFAVFTTPLENMPQVDMGNAFINTVYFGASADDVEQLVTTKIEDALDGLEDVEFIQSYSYRNYSFINVKFIDDSDYKTLYDELRLRVLNIKDELPSGADEPEFTYIDTYLWLPVIIVNITGDMSQSSLVRYAEELKIRLTSIKDVRDVRIEGEFDKEFHVSVDPEKLRRYGITFNQVVTTIRSANTKIPTGRFRKETTEFMLDAGNRLKTQEEVLDVIVRRDGDGNFVRVRDLVTTSRMSHRDPSVIPSVNGENAVRLVVTKEERGNSVTISEAVSKVSKAFEALHERDGARVVFTNDSIIEINDSINTLGGNLLLGMSLVFIVLWLTLGFRNAMLTAVGIPFSFLCSIIVIKFTGMSLNTISLFAFVLVTGIMVDDAVIIIENIFRHLEMGKSKVDAVVDGTAEIMLPVISSALTTILAFVPMLIMTGSTGDFFAVIPKTVTYALFASLVEALFILPIHFLDWGPKRVSGQGAAGGENDGNDPFRHLRTGVFAPFWKAYYWIVVKILNHKLISFTSLAFFIGASVAILVLSATGIVPLIKVKFFPGNYFRYHVTIQAPTGFSIEKADMIVRDLSRFIMSLGLQQAQSASGSAGFYEDQDYQYHTGNNFGQIVVTLPEEKNRDFPENPTNDPIQHLEYIRKKIGHYIDEKYNEKETLLSVGVFEESDGPPTGKPVNVRVTASTLPEAVAASDHIMAYMRNDTELSALFDLRDDRPEFHKTIRFVPKEEKIFEFGLLPSDVIALTAGALNGQYAGDFRTVDEEVDLLVRLARIDDPGNTRKSGLADPTDILDIPVVEDSVSPVRLRDLVSVTYVQEPSTRIRYKSKPTVTITADIKSGSKLSPARVQKKVADFFNRNEKEFIGVSLSFGGEFESTSKSYMSLTFAFFIALLGIYMVLASQFNDYFQPIIIISAVPFALMGVVLGLFVTRTIFTVGSFMSIVGLTGLVVNDSLLLIDFINVRLREGKPMREAVIESCAARMRPVLITTVTTALGLLPMAIGIPSKSISWSPMAIAFVAGLSSATTLTLLMIPAIYELVEQFRNFCRRKGTCPAPTAPYESRQE